MEIDVIIQIYAKGTFVVRILWQQGEARSTQEIKAQTIFYQFIL